MLCEFVDGSKTAVEMAAVSTPRAGPRPARNARRPLHRVAAHAGVRPESRRRGAVEGRAWSNALHRGPPRALPHHHHGQPSHPRGPGPTATWPGPFYTPYRPFHLCSIQVPLTIAQRARYGESSGHARGALGVGVHRDRQARPAAGPGTRWHRKSAIAGPSPGGHVASGSSCGLAKGCVLKRSVTKGSVIRYDDIDSPSDSVLLDSTPHPGFPVRLDIQVRMNLIGLDVGTTGCKAVLVSEDGEVLGAAYRSTALPPMEHLRQGRATSEEVWRLSRFRRSARPRTAALRCGRRRRWRRSASRRRGMPSSRSIGRGTDRSGLPGHGLSLRTAGARLRGPLRRRAAVPADRHAATPDHAVQGPRVREERPEAWSRTVRVATYAHFHPGAAGGARMD